LSTDRIAVQPYRSLLFVPAHKPEWVAKAIEAGADAIILDLEDAVPEDAKADARAMLRDEIDEIRRAPRRIGAIVRPNAWGTDHIARDV
jgi:citrate lyase subunit beta / citryl-CoA lyase